MTKAEMLNKKNLSENVKQEKVSSSENMEKENKAEEVLQGMTDSSEMEIKKAIAEMTGVDVETQKKQIVDYYDLHENPNWKWAVIVYDQSNWRKHYSELERSYAVSNGQTSFLPDEIGKCIIGDCLDGIGSDVRLYGYCYDIDYCYIVQ